MYGKYLVFLYIVSWKLHVYLSRKLDKQFVKNGKPLAHHFK